MPTPIWRYPLSAAQLAAREGIPANVAYDVLASLGMDVPRATFERLYGQAQKAIALIGPTAELEGDIFPPAELIQTRSTVTSTGFQYQFQVSAVEQETGQELKLPFSIKTTYPISIAEAYESAIIEQQLRAPDYNLAIQGATLTGVYQLEPLEATA